MYTDFYGLKEKPFSLLPDPDYLYPGTKHEHALTLLRYALANQAGFSIVCGDTGAGKTTLIRCLLNEIGPDTTVGLITNTHPDFGELLRWVLMAFGLRAGGMSDTQMHERFMEFVIEQYARGKRTLLIVDEAQNMTVDKLEELRMLSNVNADKHQVLQILLAGQPGLRETLKLPQLAQFVQRIAVDCYLEPLSEAETTAYIAHRLKVAGASRPLFTPAACAAVHRATGGTPRLVNLLCDTALVYGFAERAPTIDTALVAAVLDDRQRCGALPLFSTTADAGSPVLPETLQRPDSTWSWPTPESARESVPVPASAANVSGAPASPEMPIDPDRTVRRAVSVALSAAAPLVLDTLNAERNEDAPTMNVIRPKSDAAPESRDFEALRRAMAETPVAAEPLEQTQAARRHSASTASRANADAQSRRAGAPATNRMAHAAPAPERRAAHLGENTRPHARTTIAYAAYAAYAGADRRRGEPSRGWLPTLLVLLVLGTIMAGIAGWAYYQRTTGISELVAAAVSREGADAGKAPATVTNAAQTAEPGAPAIGSVSVDASEQSQDAADVAQPASQPATAQGAGAEQLPPATVPTAAPASAETSSQALGGPSVPAEDVAPQPSGADQQLAAEKAAAEKAAAERAAAERALTERIAAERAEAERAVAEKLAAERREAQRQAQNALSAAARPSADADDTAPVAVPAPDTGTAYSSVQPSRPKYQYPGQVASPDGTP